MIGLLEVIHLSMPGCAHGRSGFAGASDRIGDSDEESQRAQEEAWEVSEKYYNLFDFIKFRQDHARVGRSPHDKCSISPLLPPFRVELAN